MSRLEEIRRHMMVKQASEQQLAAIVGALGGEWPGFHDAEAVLSILRSKFLFPDQHRDLNDVQSVPELVQRLGVKLDHIDPDLLEAARAADKEFHRKLDENARTVMAEYESSDEHKTFLAELDEQYGRKAL